MPVTPLEEKASKITKKILSYINVRKDLFKDDQSFDEFQQQLKVMEAYCNGTLEQQVVKENELSLKVEELKTNFDYAVIDKDKYRRKVLILALRSRIEYLDKNKLWPKSLTVKGTNRRNRWQRILTSTETLFTTNPNIVAFRKSVASLKISISMLIDTVMELYGNFSDIAAHNVPLPSPANETEIIEMFSELGLIPDDDKVNCVKAIIEPIKLTTQAAPSTPVNLPSTAQIPTLHDPGHSSSTQLVDPGNSSPTQSVNRGNSAHSTGARHAPFLRQHWRSRQPNVRQRQSFIMPRNFHSTTPTSFHQDNSFSSTYDNPSSRQDWRPHQPDVGNFRSTTSTSFHQDNSFSSTYDNPSSRQHWRSHQPDVGNFRSMTPSSFQQDNSTSSRSSLKHWRSYRPY